MRILIVKPSSLGDVIHALPTVDRIRRRYPEAHISWLINSELESLLARCPIIDQRIVFHRRAAGSWWPLLRELAASRFDLVLDLQGLLRSGIMTRFTRAPRRIGLSDAREGAWLAYTETVAVPREHAVDRYLRAAEHLGCPQGPVEFPLGIAETDCQGWIAVHPSARWPTKLWGDDRFATLVKMLPADKVVVTGSAAEKDRCEQIAQGRRNLAGQTNLVELAEVYRQCSVLVTNDSGPMHLAAAVGTPVVAIFGPTDPSLTGPYGPDHQVLRVDLPCSPCFQGQCRNPVPLECMQRVTVEQVLDRVKPFLAGA